MRFAFLADIQLGAFASFSGLSEADAARYASEKGMKVRSVPRTEGFEWDSRRYAEAVEAVNAIRPDAVIIGGDLVDDPNSEDQRHEFRRVTSRIDAGIPVRWVPGNHDVADDTVVPTPASLARYREAFGPDYYAFDLGSIRFLALNTVVIDHPEGAPGEWKAQYDFLADQLGTAAAAEMTPVLVGHHPLFIRHPDEQDAYWNLPLERRRAILDLVHQYDVRLGLAGHWHRNGLAFDGSFEMVTSGPVGYPLGDDPSGFRIVDFDDGVFTHEYQPLGV